MKILDTTIRDGSYAVDFKFSCKDVKDLVQRSSKIGVEYIEIGHGQGLNASGPEHGIALQTDVEYMKAAKEVSGNSKIGFFCIPGIARLEDIDIAGQHGVDFIRIGVSVYDFPKALPYISKGISIGMEVFVNFMKTYIATPKEFANAARAAYEEGTKAVYIVDSAGCMIEEELKAYIEQTREISPIKLGFHGHDNLGLAISNSLFCVKNGVDYVDCSFQGLGRSIGNASLEQLVMVLEKEGYSTGFDVPRVLEYGYAGLRNIVRKDLINPLEYMCGFAGFHSSFIKDIYKCCAEKQVDPLRLIMSYCKENRATMDYKQLSAVADTLKNDPEDNPYHFGEYFGVQYNE